jgi:serine/threonine protein kinase
MRTTRKVVLYRPNTDSPSSSVDDQDAHAVELDTRFEELLQRVAHVSAVDIHGMETVRNEPLTSTLSSSLHVPSTGHVVDGRYRIEGRLGEGGMGVVLSARNVRTGREVALKYMLCDPSAPLAERKESVSRFVREAEAVGRVRDRHVVDIYDVGGELDAPYLVMERLHGQSLRQRMRQGPISEGELLELAKGAARGVSAAHGQGVVHRDLKPENLFLARQEGGNIVSKVLDFGVSRIADGALRATLTRAGAIVGTPAYMAPEQLRGEGEADARSDVYALGAIMYEALSGKRPYPGRTPHELVLRMAKAQVQPLAKVAPHVSPWLCSVVMKCLARDPARRFAHAGELCRALEAGEVVAPAQTLLERFLPVLTFPVLLCVLLGPGLGASRFGSSRAAEAPRLREASVYAEPPVPPARVHPLPNPALSPPSAPLPTMELAPPPARSDVQTWRVSPSHHKKPLTSPKEREAVELERARKLRRDEF